MATNVVRPSFEEISSVVDKTKDWSNAPNLIPLCIETPSEFLTPASVYLKVAYVAACTSGYLLWIC